MVWKTETWLMRNGRARGGLCSLVFFVMIDVERETKLAEGKPVENVEKVDCGVLHNAWIN